VTNETATPVELRSVRLRTGAQFQVVVNGGPLPRTLAPGASTTIEVITRTGTTRGTYSDMLELELGCRTESFPLLVRRTAPCMAPDDLDFGSIPMGGQRSMELRLCNSTPDTVVFGSDPATVVTLGSPNFTVSDADRQALAGLQLPTGGCISIQVLFTAGDSGVYRTTATFATNSVVTCRDSSRLTARVEFVNAAPDDVRAGDALTMALEPNPFVGSTEVRFAIPRGAHTTVTVHDARGGLVGTLVDGFRAAGEHRAVLDAHGLPAGVYHVRIVSGDLSLSRVVVKR
jgi:hypothetical protein